MDLLGYAALGGLERIAIIAGALLVGYWGYRLYAREQSAGLLFMGLACLVLIGALLTSGRHVRAVGESVQLARGTQPGAEAAKAIEDKADDGASGSLATAARRASGPPESGAETATATPVAPATAATGGGTPDAVSASADDAAAAAPAARETEAAAEATGEAPVETAAAERQRGLASAQELGGRIVSVKSANVTLEWTEPPARSP